MTTTNKINIHECGIQIQNNIHLAIIIMERLYDIQTSPNMPRPYDWLWIYDIMYNVGYGNSINISCGVCHYMELPADAGDGDVILYLGSRCKQYLDILDKISQNINDTNMLLWNRITQVQNTMNSDISRQFLESWI